MFYTTSGSKEKTYKHIKYGEKVTKKQKKKNSEQLYATALPLCRPGMLRQFHSLHTSQMPSNLLRPLGHRFILPPPPSQTTIHA